MPNELDFTNDPIFQNLSGNEQIKALSEKLPGFTNLPMTAKLQALYDIKAKSAPAAGQPIGIEGLNKLGQRPFKNPILNAMDTSFQEKGPQVAGTAIGAAEGGPLGLAANLAMPSKTWGDVAGQAATLGTMKYLPGPIKSLLGGGRFGQVASNMATGGIGTEVDRRVRNAIDQTNTPFNPVTAAAGTLAPGITDVAFGSPARAAAAQKQLSTLQQAQSDIGANLQNQKAGAKAAARLARGAAAKTKNAAKDALDAAKAEWTSVQDSIPYAPQSPAPAQQQLNKIYEAARDKYAQAQQAFKQSRDNLIDVGSGAVKSAAQRTYAQNIKASQSRLADVNEQVAKLSKTTPGQKILAAAESKMAYLLPWGIMFHGPSLERAGIAATGMGVMIGWNALNKALVNNKDFGDQLGKWLENGATPALMKTFPAVQNFFEENAHTVTPPNTAQTPAAAQVPQSQ